jgi:hypothetical protein
MRSTFCASKLGGDVRGDYSPASIGMTPVRQQLPLLICG